MTTTKQEQLTEFNSWYYKLSEEKQKFYLQGFVNLLGFRVGFGLILFLIIGLLLGHWYW